MTDLAYYAMTDTLYVAERDLVRAVAADGSVTTIAGGGDFPFGVSTRFTDLAGIAVDALTGVVYLAEKSSPTSTVFRIDFAQPCPPGFFCANNRTGTPCPPGTFNPSAGQGSLSACSPCPAGTANSLAGQASSAACAPCAPGTASPSGQATCSPCAANTFALAQGSGACASCSGGNVSTPAAAVCCALGAWAAPGSAACTACAAGRYRDTAGSSSADCAACPAGLTSYAGAGACCAAGQYLRPGAAACSACRAGSYSAAPGLSSEDGCTPCPNNTYSVTPGAVSDAVCLPCQEGTFSAPGATACTACRPGYFLENATLGRCAECSPGTFSSAGATACQGCPAGSFAPTGASVFCLPCPAGSFCPPGSAQPSACPANYHVSTLGSANASACEPCPPATLAARGAAECIPDPTAALSCPAGSQPDLQGSSCAALASCPQPLAPYLSAEGRLQFCQACPPGTAGSAPGACAACQQPGQAGLCPGATLRPLWNFSAPEAPVAEAQGPWGGGCTRLASPAAVAAAAAAAAAGGAGWGGGGAAPGGAPEALALQPPSTATLAVGGTLFALLLLCAAALRLGKLSHATLQAALRKADGFALEHDVQEGQSPVKVTSPMGGACTLLGYCFIGTYAVFMLVEWSRNNNLAQRSLDVVEAGTWAGAAGLPWVAGELPGLPGARGLALRLTLDGDPGKCAAPLLGPPGLLAAAGSAPRAWQLLPGASAADCSSARSGGASQLTFVCPDCELDAGSSLSLLFHYSCQSMLLEAAALPAAYPRASPSLFSAVAAPGGGALLSSVQWTLSPVLTLLYDSAGIGGSQRGYAITHAALATRSRQAEALPSAAAANATAAAAIAVRLLPNAAAVNVTVLLPLSPFFVSTTVVEVVPLTQLLANIVGLGGMLSWFAWLYVTASSSKGADPAAAAVDKAPKQVRSEASAGAGADATLQLGEAKDTVNPLHRWQ